MSQLITATYLNNEFENPYRQPQPLRLNDSSVEINPKGSSIMLSSEYATYIYNARQIVKNAGFKIRTPVIDLTGQSPTLVYLINAENLGLAWGSGGHPGSFNDR